MPRFMEPMPTATPLPTTDAPMGTRRSAGVPGLARLGDFVERNVFVVYVLAACCALHAWLFLHGNVVSDSWYSLVGGRTVARSGLPHHDTLAVLTAGREWVDQQWLAHLGLYGLWLAGGWRLALLSVVVLYLAAFAVAAAAARLLGASDRSVALAAGAGFITGISNTVFRAQIPAYVLFSLVFVLLAADARKHSRLAYLVFPLLLLWANIHGSVVLGAALVALRGATLAGAGLRTRAAPGTWLPRAAAFLALPWACTLASPYGLGLVGYYRSVLGNSEFERFVTEWAPSTLRGQPFFFALLLAGVALVARSGALTTTFERLALAGAGLLGLVASRNIVWFALVAAAVLPSALDALWSPSPAPRRRRLNLAFAGTGLFVALAAVGETASHDAAWFSSGYPPRAAAAVTAAAAADPQLLVFANERYADWLLFEYPQLAGRVAYDARLELLSGRQLRTLYSFRTEQGLDWQRAANGYGVLVLDPAGDAGAVRLYERRPGTSVLFRDRDVVVLRVRTAGSGA